MGRFISSHNKLIPTLLMRLHGLSQVKLQRQVWPVWRREESSSNDLGAGEVALDVVEQHVPSSRFQSHLGRRKDRHHFIWTIPRDYLGNHF